MLLSKKINFFNQTFLAISSEKGLVFFGTEERGESLITQYHWLHQEGENTHLAELSRYLTLYEKGQSIAWCGSLDEQYGTAFQKEVWFALESISYGSTVTYGDIARRIGKPKAVQAVGTAIGKNPWLIIVPCHRVLPKSGGIGGYSSGISLKQKLLSMENSLPYKS